MADAVNGQQIDKLIESVSKLSTQLANAEKKIDKQDKAIDTLKDIIDSLIKESNRNKLIISKMDEKLRFTREKLNTVESNLRYLSNKR